MSRFIETIQLKDGKFLNLEYHQRRVNRTFLEFFPLEKAFHLEELLPVMDFPAEGRFRCTLQYTGQPGDLKIVPYQPRKINKLILKEAGDLEYPWKYADRSGLNKLTQGLATDEEIIIIKNGLATDASYANLIFFDGKSWLTPSSPLLPGTKRQKLLDEGKITEAIIKIEDLQTFSKCSLINAMVDMGEVEVGMSRDL